MRSHSFGVPSRTSNRSRAHFCGSHLAPVAPALPPSHLRYAHTLAGARDRRVQRGGENGRRSRTHALGARSPARSPAFIRARQEPPQRPPNPAYCRCRSGSRARAGTRGCPGMRAGIQPTGRNTTMISRTTPPKRSTPRVQTAEAHAAQIMHFRATPSSPAGLFRRRPTVVRPSSSSPRKPESILIFPDETRGAAAVTDMTSLDPDSILIFPGETRGAPAVTDMTSHEVAGRFPE